MSNLVSFGLMLLGTFYSFISQWLNYHTMPESDKEVQRLVEEVFGFKPCLWQILIVCAILAGEDVITNIAPTGSGKSLTYWIPLLYIKHSITVVISPLSLIVLALIMSYTVFIKLFQLC